MQEVLFQQIIQFVLGIPAFSEPEVNLLPVVLNRLRVKIYACCHCICKICQVHALLERLTPEPSHALIFIASDQIQEGFLIQKLLHRAAASCDDYRTAGYN